MVSLTGPPADQRCVDHLRRSTLNYFSAGDLDRATLLRPLGGWLADRLADPATRIVPVWRSRSLLSDGAIPEPVLFSPNELATAGIDCADAILLGTRAEVAYFALDVGGDETAAARLIPPGASYHELRDVGPLLDDAAGALLAYARAMTHWHARHRHCGDCGSRTRSEEAGHMRVCTRGACAQRHFPRTDPAIIVLVVHAGAGDERCLLGRQQGWPQTLYSAVAGFVEPGESLEDAVVREVAEETGIAVRAVHYHSSQPWPFPSSIMLGFTADADADADAIVRHDQELADARWFTRADIARALGAGELRVPRRVSIAYRLLEDWFDADRSGALAALLEDVPPPPSR